MLTVPKVGASAPATTTAVDVITDPYTLALTSPVTTHGGVVHELKLREPIAADYIALQRVPFDVRGDGDNRRSVVHFDLAAKWASRLTGHDEIVLGTLSRNDWLGLVTRVNSILMQAE